MNCHGAKDKWKHLWITYNRIFKNPVWMPFFPLKTTYSPFIVLNDMCGSLPIALFWISYLPCFWVSFLPPVSCLLLDRSSFIYCRFPLGLWKVQIQFPFFRLFYWGNKRIYLNMSLHFSLAIGCALGIIKLNFTQRKGSYYSWPGKI